MAPCHSGCGRHTSHASETSHETFSEAPQLAALKQGGLVQEGYEVYHCLALLLYSLLYPDTPWMMQCHIYLHCLSTLCVGSGSSPRSGDTSVSGVRSEVLATERGAHAADEAGGVGGGRGEVEDVSGGRLVRCSETCDVLRASEGGLSSCDQGLIGRRGVGLKRVRTLVARGSLMAATWIPFGGS